MRFYSYCPKCGYIESTNKCPHCSIDMLQTDELYNFSDYANNKNSITEQIYKKYKVKENPQFNQKRYELRLKEEEERRKKAYEPSTHQFSFNKIKCPKCGSTTVTTGERGFSIVTGFIGAGSTVNRCGNCGYKWKPHL